jgi:hypothetical protein
MNSPQPIQPEWTGQPAYGSGQQQQWYGAYDAPAGWQPYPPGWAPGPEAVASMPGTVIAGLVMTYIGAGLMALLGLGLLIGATNREFTRGFAIGFGASTGASAGTSMVVLVASALVLWVFSAILTLPAVLAYKGRSGGRTALTVIGGIALTLNLFALVTGNVKAVPSTLWIAVAVGLLWAGQASAWFGYMAHLRGQDR